jgi:hypothetical protein
VIIRERFLCHGWFYDKKIRAGCRGEVADDVDQANADGIMLLMLQGAWIS